ncbi:10019_t:CDS:2, partial [Diversispora eburnea]
IIAFIFGWKLTLVVLATVPAFIISAGLQMRSIAGFGEKTRKAYEESNEIVQQRIMISSLGFGFAQGALFFIYALAF